MVFQDVEYYMLWGACGHAVGAIVWILVGITGIVAAAVSGVLGIVGVTLLGGIYTPSFTDNTERIQNNITSWKLTETSSTNQRLTRGI